MLFEATHLTEFEYYQSLLHNLTLIPTTNYQMEICAYLKNFVYSEKKRHNIHSASVT